jgi:hypothetical protein
MVIGRLGEFAYPPAQQAAINLTVIVHERRDAKVLTFCEDLHVGCQGRLLLPIEDSARSKSIAMGSCPDLARAWSFNLIHPEWLLFPRLNNAGRDDSGPKLDGLSRQDCQALR